MLSLNIHFHTLALDGVYLSDPASGAVRFRRLPPPSPDDLDRVLVRTRRRIRELLSKRGLAGGSTARGGADTDDAAGDPSALDALQGASVQGLLGLSGVTRTVLMSGELADPPDEPVEPPEKPFSRNSGDGYNLEAGRRIRAGDREGLERICRYVVRPPFCQERLRRLPDGRVVYQLRNPWPDGSTHLVLDPVEFLGKLAALVPPPRSHLLRYHGVLAPNARRRRAVVPARMSEPRYESTPAISNRRRGGRMPRRLLQSEPCREERSDSLHGERRWRQRMRRADLLRRTMGLDALECPRCRGHMEPIAEILEPGAVGKILRSMGLPDTPPRLAPARSPPQLDLDFAQEG